MKKIIIVLVILAVPTCLFAEKMAFKPGSIKKCNFKDYGHALHVRFEMPEYLCDPGEGHSVDFARLKLSIERTGRKYEVIGIVPLVAGMEAVESNEDATLSLNIDKAADRHLYPSTYVVDSSKDVRSVEIDVTDFVRSWIGGDIPNKGLIVFLVNAEKNRKGTGNSTFGGSDIELEILYSID